MKTVKNRTGTCFLALAAIALLGVACGGGGDSSGPTAPNGASVAEVEFESFQLANSARSNSNVKPPLNHDEKLSRIARAHSEAMRDQDFFGHHGPDGGLGARLRAAGIPFSTAGENLAKLISVPNPAGQAHAQFMDSPPHRDVMLDPRFRLAGVGVARSGNTYWLTQVYISP